ncbi:MAG: UbiH/UbiF family hydroxylase [Nitrosomonas sp.]|nr:UbiH/UbiF family hydroxylase [Nitrosomonas sp.]MBP9871956.1 UbiH/UbiF family hydroxylase [Nitrosomonas sp.]HRB28804.1 UbiH/UbiF family hydroxylase [Nitrosomonas sp.]
MKFDIVVVGGGLVGLCLAVALKESDFKIALIEPHAPTSIPQDLSWDSRVYAISPGSADFLTQLGVWQLIANERITPVYDMAVFGDDHCAQIDFSAYEIGLPQLAYIVENRQLQNSAWNTLKTANENMHIFSQKCTSIEFLNSHVILQLENSNQLETALIVGADGINSWVRNQTDIRASKKSYQQIGVVANFETELSHRHIARQWFRRDGILAFLPLPEKRVSIVWSTSEQHAHQLCHLTPEELCHQVQEASFNQLGKMKLITPPVGFPLNSLHVEPLVKPRLVLIGDAAHGIHPLAGQGVNLGLRDTRELARVLNSQAAQSDCGDYMMLRRYEITRKEDIVALEWVTDGLQKLFNNPNPTIARLRNLGLEITNRLPLIKNHLMQHALN